jgi:peptide/nickel transport system permease protein
LLKQLLRTASLFAALTVLTFALAEGAPGDFLTTLRLAPEVSAETERAARARLQLDRPWVERYLAWSRSAVAGEFGQSLAYGVPVRQLLGERLPNTLWLNLVATVGAWLLALAAGAWAAAHTGSWVDRMIGALQAVLAGVPELLLALVGLWLFGGRFWLPYAVLLLGALPTLLVHARGALRAAVKHPSVAAAGAHRIRGARLWWGYVAPLAAPPLVALAGLSFGGLLSASLLVEAALSYPGLGSLMLDAIQARDTAVVAAIVALAGALLLLANLLAEAAQRLIDPRRAGAR